MDGGWIHGYILPYLYPIDIPHHPAPGAKPPDTSLTRVISRGKSNYVEEKLLATRRQDTNYNIVGYIITTDSFDAESVHTKNVATKYNLFITILGNMHIPTC